MGKEKYSAELLKEAVKNSTSYSDVLKYIGYKTMSGGMWSHIKKRIFDLELDTSHFRGSTPMKGRQSPTRKTPGQILVISKNRKPDSYLLKRALIEIGRHLKCEQCNLESEWQNKKLVLQVDHIDGDRCNNTPENLRFLCPNCHSQTENFGVKNSPKYKNKKLHKCVDCGKEITKVSIRCKACAIPIIKAKIKYKINWPPTNELIEMVNNTSYLQAGKLLGVSDNAIRKRIKNHM